jgi:putative toxin-antitoxin system antitoxin component (TIGR02293 family)
MDQILSVAELLGGPKVLGKKAMDAEGMVGAIRAGMPYGAFDALRSAADLSSEEARALLGIPRRTLARRRKEGHLAVEESDRMFRFASVMARALHVFGDREKAVRWLRKPNRALGGVAPLSRLDTEVGAREVESVLGRLEYGVFS